MSKTLTRTIWTLSWISLFTDMASEMLYPVMPLFLRSIGFSVLLIGLLEGMAEATAGLSKGYFGKRSDVSGRRAVFVQWGYAFSAISKPLMAVWTYPLWIFLARTVDRLGKGIRTGARDAMLSAEARPETKARIFGFHRSMDTLGAVIGPLMALLFLYFYPENYQVLFLLAFIPGFLAIILSLRLKDKTVRIEKTLKPVSFFSFLRYWKESPVPYRRLVTGLLAFTLLNSSDLFLLLRAREMGFDDTLVIGVYIFYNLVFAVFAFPVGIVADRIGLRRIFILGLSLFAAVYFGMAFQTSQILFFALFFLYGLYAAATEGIAKAWITNITDEKDAATAIGTYTGFQSLFALLASSLTGVIWFSFGATFAFLFIAAGTVAVIAYFLFLPAAIPGPATDLSTD